MNANSHRGCHSALQGCPTLLNGKGRQVAAADRPGPVRLCEGKARADVLSGAGLAHVRLPDSRRGWFVSARTKCMAADKTFQRVTINDLRHTAASLAISAGANVK